MPKVIAFTGPSNSGKTTIIAKLVKILSKDLKVATIKHDPKDKAIFDIDGKDSDILYKAGADVCIVSPTRTTIFKKQESGYQEAINALMPFDWLLIEGLKGCPFPRIGVFRQNFDDSYLGYLDAIATDDSISVPSTNIARLDLNNPNDILAWMNKNAKEL